MRRLLHIVLVEAVILGGGTLAMIVFAPNPYYWALVVAIAVIGLIILRWTDPARKNMSGDVVEAIISATKEDAHKIFYAYMERRYRDRELDVVAAYILRNINDLNTVELTCEVNRLVNGMGHVQEEDKHRYSMDVLERVSKMLEENPPN